MPTFDDVKVGVVIVTHNSQAFLEKNLSCLRNQTRISDMIVVVDSSSSCVDYLSLGKEAVNLKFLFFKENIGFCKANNIGSSYLLNRFDYILFLNPDAFLSSAFIEEAIGFMELSQNKKVGALTGLLLGFDITSNQPTGLVDSTGIFRNWYGRWFDRYQGVSFQDIGHSLKQEEVPAICAAVMFCRTGALKDTMISNSEVFDNHFFMYKEDIDLSIRLRSKGWKLMFLPSLTAYHCRGWNKDRAKMPTIAKRYSALNEVRIDFKYKSFYLIYSMIKLLYVFFVEDHLEKKQ